ncbi:Hypothetical predicted protein, partial [Paramuricea clavata]
MPRSIAVEKASHPQPLSEGGEKVDRSIRGRKETTTCQPRIRDRGGIGDGVDGSVAVSDRDQAGGSSGTDVNLAGAVAGLTPSSWAMEVEEESRTKVNLSRPQPLSEEEMAGNSRNNSGNTLGPNPNAPTVNEEDVYFPAPMELANYPGSTKNPPASSSGSRERNRDRGHGRRQDDQGHHPPRDKCGDRRNRDRDRESNRPKENLNFFQDGKLMDGRTEVAASGSVPLPASGSGSAPSTSKL